jgi:hypothetical protein
MYSKVALNFGKVRPAKDGGRLRSSRSSAKVGLIAALLLAMHVPVRADTPQARCAIMVNQCGAEHGEVVADLFAAALADHAFGIVDRTHIAKVLQEHKLALGFSDATPAKRRLVCDATGADLLVLLDARGKKERRAVEWTVAAMPSGLRLASGVATWDEDHPERTLDALLGSVQRAYRLSRTDDLQLVCVPAFVCTGPMFDHAGRQASFARLTEEILLATPNVAVVALAEVDALKQETQLTARDIVRRVPLTIMGSFETKRTDSGLQTTLQIKLLAAGKTLGERRIANLDDAQIASELSKAVTDLLRKHSSVRVKPSKGGEVAVLIDQALAYMEVGALEDAIPLLKTAVLLDPNNLDTRDKLFWAWYGMATTMTRVREKIHSVERVEMLENTLDEFEEIARRRALTKRDVFKLSQTRGHGHAYGAHKRTAAEFLARYYEYCTRFRAIARKIYEGNYRTEGQDARTEAWRLLIRRFGADCYDSPETVYPEMHALLKKLANQNDKHVEILEILMKAKSPDDYNREVDREFWKACCPPRNKRMAALAEVAAALRDPDKSAIPKRFETALAQATSTLELTAQEVARIREVTKKSLDVSDIYARRQELGKLNIMPRVEHIFGSAKEKVTDWLTNCAALEFVLTTQAIYRVTPELSFIRIYEIENATAVWDSRYLWLATDQVIKVIDPDGNLIAHADSDAKKYLTPISAGKVFIARHDLSDQGAKRAAHEIWTLRTDQGGRLESELLYIADRNSTIGVQQRVTGQTLANRFLREGRLIEGAEGAETYLFFNRASRIMSVDSHEFHSASGARPRYVSYFFLDGAHYWIAGYRKSADSLRSRAIFRAKSPEHDVELVADLGWNRYRGNSALRWRPAARSAVIHDGWLHFIDLDHNCPPQWIAINLQSGDVRALATAIYHIWEKPMARYYGRHRTGYLIDSAHFGLTLLSAGVVYRVELPPADTWIPYDEVVKDLRVPAEDVDLDPWKDWRGAKAGGTPQP